MAFLLRGTPEGRVLGLRLLICTNLSYQIFVAVGGLGEMALDLGLGEVDLHHQVTDSSTLEP
jgi:hypothetical protein